MNVSTAILFFIAHCIGSEQSVESNGSCAVASQISSSRCRGEIAIGMNLLENAITAQFASVRAVTIAMADEPTRGVSPGIEAIVPADIEPETSSASNVRFPDGTTFPNEE